jgi:3-methyladenine DNA glycosylase AlkD
MTKEEKQLLLVDLSARLPYGVFCVGITYKLDDDGERYIPVKVKDILSEIHNYKLETASVRLGLISSCKLETVKPYLRPMSSMTEEEKEELIKNFWGSHTAKDTFEELSWYLSKHFDINELIPRGLAVAVTEENNPYKE